MRPILYAVLLFSLAGCTTMYTPPPPPADHPAQAAAAGTEYTPPPNGLAPEALVAAQGYVGREDGMAMEGMAGMDHAAMGHTPPATGETAMDHAAMGHVMDEDSAMAAGAMDSSDRPVSEKMPLQQVLDAYLAIGAALAADQTEGVAMHAGMLLRALAVLTQTPPEGQPHFWHQRTADLEVLRTRTATLATGPSLAGARTAYGYLSDALARIVAATSIPAAFGQPVYKMVCGMTRDVPQGGVWLQVDDEARNPYFGTQMLRCVTDKEVVPAAQKSSTEGHDGHH